jgi:hypothetical protein
METDTLKHTTKLIGTVKRYDPDNPSSGLNSRENKGVEVLS